MKREFQFQIHDTDASLIEQMSKEHRDILTTSGSYVEIAAVLNIPIGTVRSRLHRARKNLTELRNQPAA
jgi:DNA-directed RNA polymerase specialized sigma24 family protein